MPHLYLSKLTLENDAHRQRQRIPTSLLAAFAAATLLSACGGGGSSSAPAAPTTPPVAAPGPVEPPVAAPTPAPSPAPVNPSLVTSVTAPTYAGGTVEKGAWDVLMRERAACGFGLVQQDTRFDTASQAHAFHLAKNSAERNVFYHGHFEDPSLPYFIGNSPTDRLVANGFPSIGTSSAEDLDAQRASYVAGSQMPIITLSEAQGSASTRRLLTTVYHLLGVLHEGRFGGVGSDYQMSSVVQGNTTFTVENYRFGVMTGAFSSPQLLGTGNLATYPCGGATAASANWQPVLESPAPFPEITSTSTHYGTPVYFKADPGSSLVVSTATVTRVSTGASVALRQMTKANDPNAIIKDNEVFIVPTSPLVVGAAYDVSASGTLNGVAFTRTFTFTPAP